MSILVNNTISGTNQVTPPATPLPVPQIPSPDIPQTAADQGPPAKIDQHPTLTPAELKQQLDKTLKKTGISADIEIKDNGIMVVKYTDQETQQVAFQIPNQTVLDLIASLKQAQLDSQAAPRGAIIDQKA